MSARQGLHLYFEGTNQFTAWFLALGPSGTAESSVFGLDVSVPADAVFPRHLGLLVLGGSDDGLGDVAGRGPGRGWRSSTLFFWNPRGFGGQGRAGLMEVVERRLVGEVVRVEVLVKVEVGLQSLHLLPWLRCSTQGHGHQLGVGVVGSSRGRVAVAGRMLGSAHDVRLRQTGPDGLVGGVQVLGVGAPGLAAGGVGRGGGATKGAVTEGGDARAGAARQRGATATQDRWRTGGRGRYRVEGRLGGREEDAGLELQTPT